MAKSIRDNIALMTESDVKKVISLDAKTLSTTPDAFVRENLLTYYVAANTWLHIVRQWSEYGSIYLLNRIKDHGLVPVIKEFSDASDQIVHGEAIASATVRMIMRDIENHPILEGIPHNPLRPHHHDVMSAILLVCRYLKRFTPVRADKLQKAAFDDFRANQRRLKVRQRTGFPRYVLDEVKESLTHAIAWDKLCDELDAVRLDDIVFTPGVSFDTDAGLLSKLSWLAREHLEYFPMPMGLPLVSQRSVAPGEMPQVETWGKEYPTPVHAVRLAAVPKNYKTARVIAPEDLYRQSLARRYFMICDRFLPGAVNIHDQTRNQQLALEGSITGRYSTLDLHAASDSVSRTLYDEVFPRRFRRLLDGVLPTHFDVDHIRSTLQCVATMGNSMTFWLESILFYAIAEAARNVYRRYGIATMESSVYGDDIICDTRIAPLVDEFLKALGFVVNESKSFMDADHRYRESCGEEYYQGRCVSSTYYPRFPIQGQLGGQFSSCTKRDGFTGVFIDTMTALVDLQHKLFSLCVPASLIVSELIKEAMPRMTSSTPEEGLGDIWAYESAPILRGAPAQKPGPREKESRFRPTREQHLTPVVRYELKYSYIPPHHQDLFDLYKYKQFLMYGPRYEDPLFEMLHISERPMRLGQAAGVPVITWVPLS